MPNNPYDVTAPAVVEFTRNLRVRCTCFSEGRLQIPDLDVGGMHCPQISVDKSHKSVASRSPANVRSWPKADSNIRPFKQVLTSALEKSGH